MSRHLNTKQVRGKCRRSKVKRNSTKTLTLMYANVQGVRGKKTSLKYVMDQVNADVVMLAETMTRKVSVDGCQCIIPSTSTGQNVAILLANSCTNCEKMKLYDPNETINMLGTRIVVNGVGMRLYTAHLKQQSTTSRDDIRSQFDEIKNQFKSANSGREPMLLACDANVHVGKEGISKCTDAQDWGGKIFLEMLESEGLILLNNSVVCNGVVTRVDPRDGSESTIDLVICNTHMMGYVVGMDIDECSSLKLINYGKKVTKTDHNTILVKLSIDQNKEKKSSVSQNHKQKHYNTKNVKERETMKGLISGGIFDGLFTDLSTDIDDDLNIFISKWMAAMDRSFHVVKPSKSIRKGVDAELKQLLDKEKWIRKNVQLNPERGKQIAEIQKQISAKVQSINAAEIERKVNEIVQSDSPHSKVFRVRRNLKSSKNLDFPLKDEYGVQQVSKEGVDRIINEHFQKVFAQNPIPDQNIWKEYWMLVDEVFNLMDQVTKRSGTIEEPTIDEIIDIIHGLDKSKATYGILSIDMVKLGGEALAAVIHRCILKCIRLNTIPAIFREEKMTILLKNKGKIDNINDYRGIFLRNIILSIFQKWLYIKNAEKVDGAGSEYACGGRQKRSGMEALLIVKLVQDYSRWTNKEIVIKFMDVEKFFDSMNFEKALMEAYKCGVEGQSWQCYKMINEKKTCVPCIPSGKCTSIEVENVFAQGSCDAVLMAWPLMDADSKLPTDPFTENCFIEGILINRLSFVDDLSDFSKNCKESDMRNVGAEVFEKKNRLKYKIPKCKVMRTNASKESHDISLNGQLLEVVDEHDYLGTLISENGERTAEMNKRIKQTNSVVNEIVMICRETELACIRLRYVRVLMSACLDGKVKYGCALWNIMKSKKAVDDLNRIKPRLLKQVMQLPSSTPSAAVLYEFGVNDLALEVLMEKVVLAVQVLNLDEERIARKLLELLMEKEVKGFCTEVRDACSVLGVSLEEIQHEQDVRSFMKIKVIEVQKQQLFEKMMLGSKMDMVLLSGFNFDGTIKRYLAELDFVEARSVFMARYRMLPTKSNFPGRWKGNMCNLCGFVDSDVHLFKCPGYADLNPDDVRLDMFFNEEILNDMNVLSAAAQCLCSIIVRLEEVQMLC